ncbi:Beta-galactosidase 7 [Ranunculus cassubicifolius]
MGACRYLFLIIYLATLASGAQVSYDSGNLLIDGVPKIILSGSIHYPRSTVQMWPDLIQKAKEGGLDTIETYVFWDRHEPHRREYDFSGNLDLIRFLKTIQDAGLGFPVWLHNLPGIQLRTDNEVYKEEMETFTNLIVDMCKKEKLFASQGGPIILSQIENEYGNIQQDYRQAGKSYVKWCAKMAESLNIGVPWIMCQQADAPQPMINTCNGFYCDAFTPNNPKSPKMWTENWTGWFKSWDSANPHRTAEDVAFSVARFFQTGGVLQNYYMYHGGTNFGRTAGGPYITTSYDYDAPLDEYGNLAQPKWGHLKKLHELTTYRSRSDRHSICFLSNISPTNNVDVVLIGAGKYSLPAWSVSILANCSTEVYNTAKVNTQTSIMVKKPNRAENAAGELNWAWKGEPIKDTLNGLGGASNTTRLLEQKVATADASDYLWYMTSINVRRNDFPIGVQTILRVNTTGNVLHVFANKKLIGSQWGKEGKSQFVFEKPIKLKHGRNYITLLSATVGLAGGFFDMKPSGIAGGPIQLIGTGGVNVTKDLSSNHWSYKVGLNGETKKFYDINSRSFNDKWAPDNVPMNRPMTWYKTTFQAPLGRDPVVVDLKGMGKGHAWVNGHSIGRYWPSFLAKENGCSDTCDYCGKYDEKMCLSNCGNNTQRWYHVPRSFLLDDANNTLVLFEEIGGNPTQVSFQTVTIGKVCANVLEWKTLELSCQGGRSLSAIEFASFGNPQGTCETFQKGTCESENSLSVVQKACVGKESCSIDVSKATFGVKSCSHIAQRRLAVQAIC